jgi:hypothetical protein
MQEIQRFPVGVAFRGLAISPSAHRPMRLSSFVPTAAFALLTAGAVQAQQTAADSAVVRRGAPVPAGQALPVATVIASPRTYATNPVLMEGVITNECTEKGCWMQVAPTREGSTGVRVTFKDYAFFIPQAMVGRRARMEGTLKVTTHSKAAAEHLMHEGARLTKNSDGTATEVQFVASGVELFR